MKIRNFITIAALSLFIITGCNSPQKTQQTSGINLANFDTTTVLSQDFYQYACGNWIKRNPLKSNEAMKDAFSIVGDSINKRLKNIIVHIAANKHQSGTIEQKIADFYNLAMDSVKLNKEGYAPAKSQFDKIGTITAKEQLIPMMVELGKMDIWPYFQYGSLADMSDSDINLLAIGQGGLGLGKKEYYLENNPQIAPLREAYKQYIVNVFKLAGLTDTEAAKKMKDVIDIEMAIAQASLSTVETRDLQANYHKMTLEELKSTVNGIDWDLLFKEMGLKDVKYIDLRQIEPIKEVAHILNTSPLEKHISYLQFYLLNGASPYLSDDFIINHFNFYARMLYGVNEQSPRWERTIGNLNNMLGEPVGEIYVKEFFPAEAKERMVKLVKNLQKSLTERIQAQTWMDDSTKTKAVDKLNAFRIKIGYPDQWKDYSSLDIKDDSFWANVCRVKAWEFADDLNRVGKPVDKEEWEMTPQTVNAFYNPTRNEICFPASLLQSPFFDMNADDAFNYGSIGVVIGHEMTHGFDDQGRHFDKDGNMTNWWSERDEEEFNKRARTLVDYFNQIEVLPGLYANGALNLGENLADHGGIMVSFQALKNTMKENPLENKDGFTPEQRFFLSYANLWATNIREEFIHYIVQNDVHPINKWRVNGTLPHIQSWYEAFNITAKDSMYIAPESRVDIW